MYLDGAKETSVEIEIREAKSRRLAGRVSAHAGLGVKKISVVVPVKNGRLCSPEDPFLYQVTARMLGDEFTSRFGMREFFMYRVQMMRPVPDTYRSGSTVVGRELETRNPPRCLFYLESTRSIPKKIIW